MNVSVLLAEVNWPRKFWHLVGGIVAIAIPLLVPWPWPFFAALATLLTWVTIESLRRREPWFGRLFFSLSAPFVRHFERRRYVGNTWFALGATILTGIFHDPILVSASLIGWTFGDPAAEIIGRIIRSRPYFGSEKSVVGTLGCFVVSLTAYLVFFRLIGISGEVYWSAALTGAAATTLAEAFSLSFTVNDNFTIPLLTALALSYVLV